MNGALLLRQKLQKEANVIRDANGNILADGDTVTVIKDLKVKGSSSALSKELKLKESV